MCRQSFNDGLEQNENDVETFYVWSFFQAMALKSLTALLLIIFWVVCGLLLGHYLYVHWGLAGYGIGFPFGSIMSSAIVWLIFGRKQRP